MTAMALAATIVTAMATTILMLKGVRWTGVSKRVNQTCTEVVLPEVRATDLELGEALTHEWQNPGSKIRAPDFGLGKPLTHRVQNPGGKIPATDFGLGKPLTHGGHNPGGKIPV